MSIVLIETSKPFVINNYLITWLLISEFFFLVNYTKHSIQFLTNGEDLASGIHNTLFYKYLVLYKLLLTFNVQKFCASKKNLWLLEAPSATTETIVKPASCSILIPFQTTGIICSANTPEKWQHIHFLWLSKYSFIGCTCCCKLSNWQVHVESYPSCRHCQHVGSHFSVNKFLLFTLLLQLRKSMF